MHLRWPLAVVTGGGSALGSAAYGPPEYAAATAGLIRFTTALADPATARRARVCCVVPGWVGLPRAREQRAALPEDEQSALPPLVPPGEVARTVVDLPADGPAGTVVELLGAT